MLKFGFGAGLEFGEGKEAADDVAKHVGRFVVFRFGRDAGLQPAVHLSADAEPGNRRNLIGDDVRQLGPFPFSTSMRPTTQALPPSSALMCATRSSFVAALLPAARVQVNGVLHERTCCRRLPAPVP